MATNFSILGCELKCTQVILFDKSKGKSKFGWHIYIKQNYRKGKIKISKSNFMKQCNDFMNTFFTIPFPYVFFLPRKQRSSNSYSISFCRFTLGTPANFGFHCWTPSQDTDQNSNGFVYSWLNIL